MTNDDTPGEGKTGEERRPGSSKLRGSSAAFGVGDGTGTPAERITESVLGIAKAAREKVTGARPEIGRLLREARSTAESARPGIERAAQEAAAFAREHESDLKTAATRAARIAARLLTPPALRSAIDAELERERRTQDDPTPPHSG